MFLSLPKNLEFMKDLKKDDIYILLIVFVVFIVVLVIILRRIKERFWKDNKKILLDDPKLEKVYSAQSEERGRYIKLLTQERDDANTSLGSLVKIKESTYLSPEQKRTEEELTKRLAYIRTQMALINVNEGLSLGSTPTVPKDLMFSYSITFKIRNNPNCYNNYCFLYRGSDVTNSSPSFWINPVDSTMCVKVKDYTADTQMELKTDTIPLQRWNTAKFVFKNRDVYVHLNDSLFASFVLDSMPQYNNSDVKIHPYDSYKFIHVSSVIYYDHALNIPVVSTPSLSIKF